MFRTTPVQTHSLACDYDKSHTDSVSLPRFLSFSVFYLHFSICTVFSFISPFLYLSVATLPLFFSLSPSFFVAALMELRHSGLTKVV